jgi:hypothetical protein
MLGEVHSGNECVTVSLSGREVQQEVANSTYPGGPLTHPRSTQKAGRGRAPLTCCFHPVLSLLNKMSWVLQVGQAVIQAPLTSYWGWPMARWHWLAICKKIQGQGQAGVDLVQGIQVQIAAVAATQPLHDPAQWKSAQGHCKTLWFSPLASRRHCSDNTLLEWGREGLSLVQAWSGPRQTMIHAQLVQPGCSWGIWQLAPTCQ